MVSFEDMVTDFIDSTAHQSTTNFDVYQKKANKLPHSKEALWKSYWTNSYLPLQL